MNDEELVFWDECLEALKCVFRDDPYDAVLLKNLVMAKKDVEENSLAVVAQHMIAAGFLPGEAASILKCDLEFVLSSVKPSKEAWVI